MYIVLSLSSVCYLVQGLIISKTLSPILMNFQLSSSKALHPVNTKLGRKFRWLTLTLPKREFNSSTEASLIKLNGTSSGRAPCKKKENINLPDLLIQYTICLGYTYCIIFGEFVRFVGGAPKLPGIWSGIVHQLECLLTWLQ